MFALGLLGCNQASDAQAQVRDHQAQGNLESRHTLGCITLAEAKNQYTPADLFSSAAACVQANKPEQVADLYILARSYGSFDAKRVSDQSAHQAVLVLQMQAFAGMSEEFNKQVSETLKTKTNDPAEHSRICRQIKQLGAPAYHPSYMLQHGMGAFLSDEGTSKALVENFNAETAWNEVLASSLRCSTEG
ncbi:hypothetical protein CO614_03125 [Lysobacteraceae bacterium NML120232]|nr:hypothetical protein CO608_06135 [Xanthomonadaceae bacterium NML08-0793]PJK13069.1 hypothetical protein CO614_03125 [Xanthomonadaceae bacterium NML120232]